MFKKNIYYFLIFFNLLIIFNCLKKDKNINFIQIIPSSIILDTPELEKWLEQAEN